MNTSSNLLFQIFLITLSQIHCTEHEIENIIEVLNPNKASGDDGISHKMLNSVSKSVSKPLCILINRSFDEGIFPDTWKLANVIPIFKKGDKSQPCNYRPVALLSCIGKGSLTLAMGKCLWFSVKIKVCQSSLSSPWSYPDLSTFGCEIRFRY